MSAEVRVARSFAASAQRIFDALTVPDQLVQWWGPRAIPTSEAVIDLRPGGRCHWVMHPDGTTAVLRGTIIEVEPPVLLSMTNQWDGDDAETIVTFRLTPTDTGTHLEIHHRQLPPAHGPEVFAEAWEAALDSLTSFVGNLTPVAGPELHANGGGDPDPGEGEDIS